MMERMKGKRLRFVKVSFSKASQQVTLKVIIIYFLSLFLCTLRTKCSSLVWNILEQRIIAACFAIQVFYVLSVTSCFLNRERE